MTIFVAEFLNAVWQYSADVNEKKLRTKVVVQVAFMTHCLLNALVLAHSSGLFESVGLGFEFYKTEVQSILIGYLNRIQALGVYREQAGLIQNIVGTMNMERDSPKSYICKMFGDGTAAAYGPLPWMRAKSQVSVFFDKAKFADVESFREFLRKASTCILFVAITPIFAGGWLCQVESGRLDDGSAVVAPTDPVSLSALCLDWWHDADNAHCDTCSLFFGTDAGLVYAVTIVSSAFAVKNDNSSKSECVTLLMETFGRTAATKGMGAVSKREAHGVPTRAGESIYALCTNEANSVLITVRGDLDPAALGSVSSPSAQHCDGRNDRFDDLNGDLRRVFTSRGLYIGTFGQESPWDVAELANPPVPPDVYAHMLSKAAAAGGSVRRFGRVSQGLIRRRKGEDADGDDVDQMERLSTQRRRRRGGTSNASSAGVPASISGHSGAVVFAPESLSSFSWLDGGVDSVLDRSSAITPASSAGITGGDMFLTCQPNNKSRRPSDMRSLHDAGSSCGGSDGGDNDSWPSKRMRTPELLQTDYRTWFGKSEFGKRFLEQEQQKGKVA
ncbi:hypothetical protein HDU84_001983 [Entophlyctis sp. JEL0112]|nr:hypothetical protein HDU84_001983 [Entophlyctis sp. JEL0112]